MDELPSFPPGKLQRCAAEPRVVETDIKEIPEEDESAPISAALLNADPIENPFQFDQMLAANAPRYRRFFVNDEEFETFMMLPISADQRAPLLLEMKRDIDARSVIESFARGAPKSTRRRSDSDR